MGGQLLTHHIYTKSHLLFPISSGELSLETLNDELETRPKVFSPQKVTTCDGLEISTIMKCSLDPGDTGQGHCLPEVTSILHEDLCRYIRYAALHCQTWPTI
jgi:hypothetical protein